MRIIAGTQKGRTLSAPRWAGLRPTSDRLRETLFNILAPWMDGARVLDVCAGTGAVGLEALSRGARQVTFVEEDPRAIALIRRNVTRCALSEGYVIVQRDAHEALQPRGLDPFDVVFVDPPYALPSSRDLLDQAARHVGPDGILVFEHASRLAPPDVADTLVLTRQVRQGDSALAFYRQPGDLAGDCASERPEPRQERDA